MLITGFEPRLGGFESGLWLATIDAVDEVVIPLEKMSKMKVQ